MSLNTALIVSSLLLVGGCIAIAGFMLWVMARDDGQKKGTANHVKHV
jgi:hypothetical protein